MLLVGMDRIDESYIQRLCADQYPESATLDFKRELPSKIDQGRHELAKDVCAMANSDGGDLVYGIGERDGAAAEIVPIVGEGVDDVKRRILQTLDAWLEPRVNGIQMKEVAVEGGFIFVLRVPASYIGPHCVVKDNRRRFVMRNGSGTSDLSYDQLRSSFENSSTLSERSRQFISSRIAQIIERKASRVLVDAPVAVIHFVPISSFSGRHSIDLAEVKKMNGSSIYMQSEWTSGIATFNLEGLVIHPSADENGVYDGYCQIFRNGVLEAATYAGGYRSFDGDKDVPIIWASDMSKFFHQHTEKFLLSARGWGISGPAILSYSLLNAADFKLAVGSSIRRRLPVADRNHYILPHSWIEDLNNVNVDEMSKRLLDTLWQGFGMERCLDFDDDSGRFLGR